MIGLVVVFQILCLYAGSTCIWEETLFDYVCWLRYGSFLCFVVLMFT